ncbi:TPA: hypothetical protein ACX6RK_001351 [Photobacterium damselae]
MKIVKTAILLTALFAYAPSAISDTVTNGNQEEIFNDIQNDTIYGSWKIKTPQKIGKRIVAGALYFEKNEQGQNQFTFALLESNGHHGCTDFIANGHVEFIKDGDVFAQQGYWNFFIDEDVKTLHSGDLFRAEDHLILKLNNANDELILQPVSKDQLEHDVSLACQANKDIPE